MYAVKNCTRPTTSNSLPDYLYWHWSLQTSPQRHIPLTFHLSVLLDVTDGTVLRPTWHTLYHFRDESFQAINCTGTDN